MRKQMRGLSRASTNAQDGVSAVQTAEGALTEVHSMLQRMNELAVQASNGTNSEADRQAIQDEVDKLNTEIDRVAETTKFNEIYLLKGDSDTKSIDLKAHDAGLDGKLISEGSIGRFTAKELKDGDSVSIGGKTYTIGETVDGLTVAGKVEEAVADAVKDGKKDDKITIDGTVYTAEDGQVTTGNTAVAEADLEKILELAVNGKDLGNAATIKIEGKDGTTTTFTYSKVQTGANVLDALKLQTAAGADAAIAAGDSVTIGDKKYEAVDTTKVVTAANAKATTGTGFYSTTYMKAGGTVTVDGVTYTYLAKEATGASEATGKGIYYKAEDGTIKEAIDFELKEGDSYSSDGTAANSIRVSDKIATGAGTQLYDAEGNKFEAPDAIEDGTAVIINVAAAAGTGAYVTGAQESEGFYDASGKLLTSADVKDLVTAGTKITFTNAATGTALVDAVTGKVDDSLAGTGQVTVAAGTALEVQGLVWKDKDGNELTEDKMTGLKDGTEVSIGATGKDFVVGTPGDSITKEQAYERMAEELKAANSIGTGDRIL